MGIDRDEVRRIAALARLEIRPDDEDRLRAQLDGVLAFVRTLNALDLDGIEPTTFAPSDAPWRDDVANGRRLTPEQATAAAPQAEDGFFLVPPVVDNLQP